MSNGPRKPACYECQHDFRYTDVIPMKRQGVMMHMNERFCLGGKKARLFKKRDPVFDVPGWCPRRKDPCELRLYGFKSSSEELLHYELCQSIGTEMSPNESECALLHKGFTTLSPCDFWERCKTMPNPVEGILERTIEKYQVLEIDDGLKPVFFLKTGRGFKLLYSFNAEIARKNKLEEE